MQKRNQNGLLAEKTLQALHISLPLFCTTSTCVKLPSWTSYGGKVVYVPTFHYFFHGRSFLPCWPLAFLIFLPQLWIFFMFFLPVNFVSFLFFLFFESFTPALSRRQCSDSIGDMQGVDGQTDGRSSDYQNFLHLQVTNFSFARARTSLILILYNEKWLIIKSATFLISCTVFAEMHILS